MNVATRCNIAHVATRCDMKCCNRCNIAHVATRCNMKCCNPVGHEMLQPGGA
jgi:hypothetical protein